MSSECVSLHVRVLRAAGFLRGRGAGAAGERYRRGVLLLTALYLAQECAYAWRVRADLPRLSRVMFLLLCHVTSLAKQLVFHLDADAVDRLLRALDDPVFEEAAGGGRLARCGRRARALLLAYSGCAVLTCTLWLVFPLWERARGRPVEFAFWTPFRPDAPLAFAAVLLYSYYGTTLVGIANTTMDAFIATLLYLCQVQLRILRENLESVVERSWRAGGGARRGPAFERALRAELARCLHHQRHVASVVREVQRVFGAALLVQFAIGGWILCMAAYKLVSLRAGSAEFASMALFMACILTEVLLYCASGALLSAESARVPGAAYNARWPEAGAAARRALALVMAGSARPLQVTAAGLVPLSLDTFVTILKSSYTFYAVLRQTK